MAAGSAGLEFRVLGPIEVRRDGETLHFRGNRELALLALLVVEANHVVAAERLVEDLSGGAVPDGALRTLRVYVSRVRQVLGDTGEVLVTRPAGYLLRVEPEAIDAARFEALVREGRGQAAAGDHARAAETLRAALGLWRGPALAEAGDAPNVAAEAARLEDGRLVALEDRLDADLACGRHGEVVGELEVLTRTHPFRERLWGQRITALYRSGRQAEALQAYRELRRVLGEQLGIDPSPELARLETAVLQHDPRLAWRAPPEQHAPGAPNGEPTPLPAPLAREERLPLVGRARQMARLEASWGSASRHCRLLLLGGEPGIGKSRLATEFARRAHGDGATVLFGRCDEGIGVPYQPFVEALGRYLRETPVPVLGPMAGELARVVPEVTTRVPDLPSPSRSDPESERYRLFEAIAAWLAAASEHRPVLFTLDDLHWATRPTLLLLSHLVRADAAMSLSVVATYRDSPLDLAPEIADVLAELLLRPGVERIRLGGLDEAGVATLVEAHAQRTLDDDGRALARVLHGETAGNPFFIREVLRHLAEKGDVVRKGKGWTLGQRLAEVDVPDTVREVVGRRLTRLPDRTDQMLALAAVLGEHFELDVLVQATGESADAVLDALDPPIGARLVEETAVGRYRFTHALVRSTLEDALGPTRRAQLHLRAAQALESGDRTGERGAAALATHYQQAGSLAPPEQVVEAVIRAGDEAVAALAWEQAAGHWRCALDLMDQTCAGSAEQAELAARLADLLHVTGFDRDDLAASIAHAEKAIALFDGLGLDRRAAVMRSRLGGYLSSNGIPGVMDIPRSLDLFEQAERELAKDDGSLVHGYLLGTLSTATGIWGARPMEALQTAPRAVKIARKLGHVGLEVLGEMNQGFALLSIGRVVEGFALLEHAWAEADRIDHRILAMRTAHVRTYWALMMREPAVALRWAERELSRPRLAHVSIQRRTLQGTLAWAYVLAGRLSDAERVLREVGGLPLSPVYAPPLALWQGDWAAAGAELREAADGCGQMGDRVNEAVLHNWTAYVCRLQADYEGAERSLEQGLAITVPAPLRVHEVGLRVEFAFLDIERRRRNSARAHLDRARSLTDGQHWGGLSDRLALAGAALAAQQNPDRATALFEPIVQALHTGVLPWEEAEALLFWSRAVAAFDPSLAGRLLDAASEVYRRTGAGQAWFERADGVGCG